MEVIYKKISTEDFKNRFPGSVSFGNDFIVGESFISDILDNGSGVTIPYSVNGNGDYVIRFRTLSNYFYWLRKFFKEAVPYKECAGKFRKVNDAWAENDGDCGPIIELNENFDSDWVDVVSELNSNVSGGSEYVILYDKPDEFYKMFNGSLHKASIFYSIAYRLLEGKCEEYVSGTTVGSYFNVPILLTETYEDLGLYSVADEDNYVPNESGDTDEHQQNESGDTIVYGDGGIRKLQRAKRSYDAESNELPFILNDGDCEIPYIVGQPQNLHMGWDGNYYYDVIVQICFADADKNIIGGKTWSEGGSDVTISADDVNDDCRYIVFFYEVGRSINEQENNAVVNGILHEEWYEISIKTITATITNVPIEFEYIDIDYDTIVMEDWDNVSRIIIENSDFNTDTYPKMPIFFDDGFSGIHNYSESSSDLYIERGSSASFEALSLMGQMNSVEDIERYRGDLFKIGNGNS